MNSVDDFKTAAVYMDYLMSKGLIKTATIIWICWITTKNPTLVQHERFEFQFNFF